MGVWQRGNARLIRRRCAIDWILGGAIILQIIFLGIVLLRQKKTVPQPTVNYPPQQIHVNLKPLQDSIDSLPGKVLQSVVSCTNTHKGALGELIGYVQLHATYDRIIPLGNIVDFVCVKFSDGTTPGYIDFVDVKTGAKSRLSSDQRELQKLIQEKRINFIKLKVETTSNDTPDRKD